MLITEYHNNKKYTVVGYTLTITNLDIMRSSGTVDGMDEAGNTIVLRSVENKHLEVVKEFLLSEGVEPKDFDIALEEMNMRGDDTASFGMFGGFVLTMFTGVRQ